MHLVGVAVEEIDAVTRVGGLALTHPPASEHTTKSKEKMATSAFAVQFMFYSRYNTIEHKKVRYGLDIGIRYFPTNQTSFIVNTPTTTTTIQKKLEGDL